MNNLIQIFFLARRGITGLMKERGKGKEGMLGMASTRSQVVLAGAGCEGCYTPPLKKFPAGWFRGENQNVNSPVPASPLGSSPSATTAAPPRFTNRSGT
jgi:hypothetical protein